LEKEAARMHLEAQALNKAGKYDEATRMYSEMNRTERRALDLAAAASTCASCEQQEETVAAARAAAADGSSLPDWPAHSLARSADEYAQTLPAAPLADAAARRRAAAAVCGAYVADCASVGVQWIYNVAVLEELLVLQRREKQQQQQGEEEEGAAAAASTTGLEFFDPVASPFLKDDYATGRPSPYGEETLVLIRALAADREGARGAEEEAKEWGLHCGRYAAAYSAAFGGGKEGAPFKGYLNASTRGFLRNYSAQGLPPPWSGADDKQADCVARVAPLVAAFGGGGGDSSSSPPPPLLRKATEMATRVTQNDDEAVAWACAASMVLRGVVLGSRVEDAAKEVVGRLEEDPSLLPMLPAVAREIASRLRDALARRGDSPEQAIAALGRNCHLPNSYQTPLQAALYGEKVFEEGAGEEAAFVAAVRGALRGGGCCSSRAQAAGALLAARLGPQAIPESWKSRCWDWDEVERAAEGISGDG
jgi:ADP-ribosylglycohydrolase